tara:strand:+ start:1629 stop:2006 length:378 start_codon:yes stop_codon:yes gene_type:complete
MPERRKQDEPLYRRPTTAKERMTQKLGPVFEYGSIIASAPAGGTVAGFKIASKIKKVYDTFEEKKPPRKPTMADRSADFGGSASTLPMPSPSKAPSRPAPAAAPAPARQPTQQARTQRRRQYRGY